MDELRSSQQALIDWYEDPANKRLSWKFMGKKIGKSGSYISRVARGECTPSFEFERDVLAYLYQGRESEVFDYLSRKYPREVTKMASMSAEATKEMSFPRPSFYKVLENRVMYHVYRLADVAKYALEELADIAGPDAPLHAEKLKKDGLIEVKNGVLERTELSRNTLNINFKAAIKSAQHNLGILAHRAEVHDLGGAQFDSSQNKVLGLYENLNEAGLLEAIEWMNSSVSELRARLQDPRYQGDIPTFINTATGRFDHTHGKRERK